MHRDVGTWHVRLAVVVERTAPDVRDGDVGVRGENLQDLVMRRGGAAHLLLEADMEA
jgi:hypothetical protein